jgi:hypothetical protein
MARYINVTLEHHTDRRYHVINHGRGRRPADTVHGKFNLRYRSEGKRNRYPLEVADLTAALQARADKEAELNAAPAVEHKGMLQNAIDNYLVGIKAGRKKKTFQAYDVALRYLTEAIGNKDLAEITRLDLMAYRTYLKETVVFGKNKTKHLSARSQYNKFENVMTSSSRMASAAKRWVSQPETGPSSQRRSPRFTSRKSWMHSSQNAMPTNCCATNFS